MSKKGTLALILIANSLFFVVASHTPAALGETMSQKIDCNKAASTPEMKYCSQQSYQAADKRLNQVYKKVISSLNSEQKQILTAAQQAWIKFRDNNCDFEVYGNRGGTGYEIFRNGCLERLTTQRTKDLENFISSR
ncbi:lysozyme inhibitor LprI family protein [Mastigocladopsis repens]|uniref:lysozyme inhibitor LprI family protein n=1 Tax=Mastigocladopsis repens TaxID=221287 RepID=UPI00030C2771|nr:lysozyme inhibitor LprI family protein [Mastigocladopsis repens]